MFGVPELLCVLAVLLPIITVVGHGIWMAVAWLFRASSGQITFEPDKPCAACGARYGVQRGRCTVCGAIPSFAPRSTLREELKVTARQLRRLLDADSISLELYDALAAVIQADLARLTTAQQAVPQPVVVSPFGSPVAATSSDDVIEADIVAEPGIVYVASTAASAPPPPPPSAPPVQRHPLDPDPVPTGNTATTSGPGLVPAKKRKFADAMLAIASMLQSFMEERNVRWMEILAGMAIVGCSIGLVGSLWSTLNKIPYFPAILFTAFTVAFHGAGLYTLRRWKLHEISRVVLLISLLLVPLAISGAVIMSGSGEAQRPATDPLFLVTVLAGVAIFGWVTWSASSELTGEARGRLTIAILGCSLSQILIHRLPLANLDFWRMTAVAAIPLDCYLIATVGQLLRARRWPQLSERRVGQILLVLGTATFALLAPLVLLLVRAEPKWPTIANLSPALSLAVSSALALGLLIHRRTTAKRLAAWQTAGTALVIFAALLLLLFVSFTWPDPELLVTIGLLNCVVLAALAILGELPLLYLPSIACAALAAVIGLHLTQGRYADVDNLSLAVVQSALMSRSSLVLTLLAAMIAGLAWMMKQRHRMADSLMLLCATGGLAVVAIAIALFAGFIPIEGWPQDRDLSVIVLLIFAAALLTAAPRARWPAVAGAGSLLLWIALLQMLWLNDTCRDWLASLGWLPDRPIFVATLTHGAITAVGALIFSLSLWERAVVRGTFRSAQIHQSLTEPLAIGAAISLLAIFPAILWVWNDRFNGHAIFALIAGAGWLALAIGQRWKWAISGLQTMLFLAPALAVAGIWHDRLPTNERALDWLVSQPHLLSQLILLGLGAIVWSAIRRLTSGFDRARHLLHADWPAVDQILLAVAAVALPILATLWTLPEAAWELGFEFDGPIASATADALIEETKAAATTHPLVGPASRPWLALAAIAAALLVALWERVNFLALAGLGLATYAAVWFAAEPFHAQAAAASAARWAAAIFALLWGVAFIARDPLRLAAKRLKTLRWDDATASEKERPLGEFEMEPKTWFGAQPLLFGGLTVLLITIVAVAQNVSGETLRGPSAESFFAQIGPTASYAAPLLAIVAVLLGYALRERRAGFACGGAAVFQLAINLAFMLYVSTSTIQEPPSVRWAEWLQWNTLALGGYALIWLSLDIVLSVARRNVVRSLRERATVATSTDSNPFAAQLSNSPLLDLQIALAAAGVLLIAATAAWRIFLNPAATSPQLVQLGSFASYLALGLALAAAIWRNPLSRIRHLPALGDLAALGLVLLFPMVAATADRFDAGGQWVAYHTLTAGWLMVGAIACGLASWCVVRASAGHWTILAPHHLTVAAIAALVIALAIRGNRLDPQQPWWSVGAVLAVLVIAAILGLARRSQLSAYASVVLAALAVLLFWFAPNTAAWVRLVFDRYPAMPEFLTLSIVAVAGFWLRQEIRWQHRRNEPFDPKFVGPAVHVAAIFVLVASVLLLRLGYVAVMGFWLPNEHPIAFQAYATLSIIVAAALGFLIIGTLWDRRGIIAIPAAYLWLAIAWLLAIGLVKHRFPDIAYIPVALFAALALHVALTGQIWSFGANLAAWGLRAGISGPVGGLARTARWLPAANVMLAATVCLIDVIFVLTQGDQRLRVIAALGPGIAAWGVLCLAQQQRKTAFQLAALLMFGLTAVYLGWSDIQPLHSPAVWLDRVFRLLMVLAVLTFLYGLALPRWLLTSGDWNAATRRAGYLVGVAAIATFVATLALEVVLFQPGVNTAAIADVQVAAIAAVLLLLIAGLVSLALLPGRDPLMLSERNRQAYVYAAQIIAALLFAHLYVCRPLWFDSILRPYWPFIVMALAFIGVGASELFHRWRLPVLAEPLERTGALLPILPVIGMWVISAQTDYALVLFVVGILYLALSYTRQSWIALAAAAVAGNGALWALMHEQGFNFAANPQFWLIPPAVSVLIASHVNRHRLNAETLVTMRYGATLVIYVSSTWELFLRGIGDSLWPPMILASLALAGAFAGIILRVKAFLFLGSAFTVVALVAMVYRASEAFDHVWPLWAFGITVGISILILFGIFEKQRAEMLALIGRLKQWEQ